MAARVDELLQAAAEVQWLCAELLELPEPLNNSQRYYIESIAISAVSFSSCVNEIADLIESGTSIRVGSGLNTPIVWFKVVPKLLSEDLHSPLSDAQRNYLRQIQACGRKADALLKILWKNDAGQTKYEE
jgi:hypothetical protein